jgi:hypothetical protein
MTLQEFFYIKNEFSKNEQILGIFLNILGIIPYISLSQKSIVLRIAIHSDFDREGFYIVTW